MMTDRTGVKVLIVNDDGQYLTGTANSWEFTDDRGKARVFDYVKDEVAEKIELVRKVQGRIWIAVKLDPREIYEFCDCCGCRLPALRAFFDGEHFYCDACREPAADNSGDLGRALSPPPGAP